MFVDCGKTTQTHIKLLTDLIGFLSGSYREAAVLTTAPPSCPPTVTYVSQFKLINSFDINKQTNSPMLSLTLSARMRSPEEVSGFRALPPPSGAEDSAFLTTKKKQQ